MRPRPCAPGTGGRFAAMLGALGILLVGCGLEPRTRFLPNQPPEVTLDRPQASPSVGESHRFGLSWRGRDPDGTVEHYVFSLDPASLDRVGPGWTKTRDVTTTIGIARRAQAGSLVGPSTETEEPHIFAVRAVDAAGAMSAPATIAFFGSNIAPEVTIVDPEPNWGWFTPYTGTSVEIRWKGTDLDGQITKYKYRLFGSHNPDAPGVQDFTNWAMSNPDSFRRMYAPDFANWDSVGPDVQSVRYTGLVPNSFHLFAITAFDDAGDYGPVFTPYFGLLRFAVTYDIGVLPRFDISSPYFSFSQAGPRDIDLHFELPADVMVPVTWFARPSAGSSIQGYRWVVDPLDPADDKSRTHPNADPNHWSPWSLDDTSATIGPFNSREDQRSEHVLYVQARDIFDRVATLRIHFPLVRPTHERELLVVDDTRLTVDHLRPDGSLQPPRGDWPTAAELDTFLYARGNHPWRGYPAGTLSPRGILAGYDFDTLGTRGLPAGIVPLSILSKYRQVIWMTNDVGSTYLGSPSDLLQPITSLRLMSTPGWMSTLSAYVEQGGKLWLLGGGAAYASLAALQRRGTPPNVFTSGDGELVEGRLMYDHVQWRSAVTVNAAQVAMLNDAAILRLFDPSRLTASPGRGWTGQPNYAKLRSALPYLTLRSRDDPPPPLREGDLQWWLFHYFTVEFLSQPNVILEDADPRPNHERLESALDTLYVAMGALAPFAAPVMTYYHGSEGGSVVFSGFPIWRFRPSQCATLVDFILQDIWGLSRRSTVVASRGR